MTLILYFFLQKQQTGLTEVIDKFIELAYARFFLLVVSGMIRSDLAFFGHGS
jgi:hypothetical protein